MKKSNEKRKRPAKASTKQRIKCFKAILPEFNPYWNKNKPVKRTEPVSEVSEPITE